MGRRSDLISPDPFVAVLRALARWRRGRVPGSRIPDDLWRAAVGLAREHGVSKTAIALRLDYYSLKDRLESPAHAPSRRRERDAGDGAAFVEIPLGVRDSAPDCVLQLEDEQRGRLRIELRGRATSDIEALALSLWSKGQ